jgi:hypothetical protein
MGLRVKKHRYRFAQDRIRGLTTRSSGPPASFRICSGRGRRPLSSGVRWAWEAGSGWQRLLACGTVLAGCLLLSRQAAHAALIVCFGRGRGFGVGFNAAWSAGRSSRLQGGGFRGVRCQAKQRPAGAHLTIRSSGPPASFRICSGRGRRPLSSSVRPFGPRVGFHPACAVQHHATDR